MRWRETEPRRIRRSRPVLATRRWCLHRSCQCHQLLVGVGVGWPTTWSSTSSALLQPEGRACAGRCSLSRGEYLPHPSRPRQDSSGPTRNGHRSQRQDPVSYTHLRAHETDSYLVCRLLLEKKKKK